MQDNASVAETADLNGRWRVIHRVETSNRTRYVGLSIEFQCELRQDGNQITGVGEKFVVDARLAARDEASSVEFTGRSNGSDIKLELVERAPTRPESPITGEIVWRAVSSDRLVGRFHVDLAETSGSSEAVRRRTSLPRLRVASSGPGNSAARRSG